MEIAIYIIILSIIGILALYFLFTHLVHKLFALQHVPNTKTPKDFGITDYIDLRIETTDKKNIQLWDINPNGKDATVFAIHGWANTAEKLLPIAKVLAEKYRVVLINARNHGDSDSDHYSTIIKFKEDILSALEYFEIKNNCIIVGHSLGGGASLLTASLRDDIDGVVCIASFANLEKFMRGKFLKGKMPRFFISSMIKYIESHAEMRMKQVSPINTIKKISSPVLLAYGNKDETVDFEDAQKIKEAAISNSNTELITMENHSHSSLLEDPLLAEKINSFINNIVLQHK